ncbi:MAG TPA: hypothetical protein VJR29_08210, partial [bacterium]|nr:hypothetical protein [bacterium]
ETKEEVEAQLERLNELIKPDGILYEAFQAAEMDGTEQVIGLVQTVAIILGTAQATRGASLAVEGAEAVFLADKMLRGFFWGAYIATAENTIAASTGEVRTERDSLGTWVKDAVSTGASMALVMPAAGSVGQALEGNTLKNLVSRYIGQGPRGLLHLAADTGLETIEEAVDQQLRKTLDGKANALSFSEIKELFKLCLAGGGLQIGALAKNFQGQVETKTLKETDAVRQPESGRNPLLNPLFAPMWMLMGMGGLGGADMGAGREVSSPDSTPAPYGLKLSKGQGAYRETSTLDPSGIEILGTHDSGTPKTVQLKSEQQIGEDYFPAGTLLSFSNSGKLFSITLGQAVSVQGMELGQGDRIYLDEAGYLQTLVLQEDRRIGSLPCAKGFPIALHRNGGIKTVKLAESLGERSGLSFVQRLKMKKNGEIIPKGTILNLSEAGLEVRRPWLANYLWDLVRTLNAHSITALSSLFSASMSCYNLLIREFLSNALVDPIGLEKTSEFVFNYSFPLWMVFTVLTLLNLNLGVKRIFFKGSTWKGGAKDPELLKRVEPLLSKTARVRIDITKSTPPSKIESTESESEAEIENLAEAETEKAGSRQKVGKLGGAMGLFLAAGAGLATLLGSGEAHAAVDGAATVVNQGGISALGFTLGAAALGAVFSRFRKRHGQDIDQEQKGLDQEPASPHRLPITSETLEVIRQAATSQEYDIRLLVKQRNGKPWLLVLMGESHAKKQEASELGQALIDQFQLRGLEGADLGKTWGGRAMDLTIRMAMGIWHRSGDEFGSSIGDAGIDSVGRDHLPQLRRVLAEVIRLERLDEMSKSELEAYEAWVEHNGAGRKIKLNGSEILKIVGGDLSDTPLDTDVTTVWLEEGHRPDLLENMASVYAPAMMFLAPLGLIGSLVGLLPKAGLLIASAALCHLKLARNLTGFLDPTSPLRAILDPLEGLVLARNETMVSNISKTYQQEISHDSMLAIVGRGHLPGMASLLTRGHGFQEVELP